MCGHKTKGGRVEGAQHSPLNHTWPWPKTQIEIVAHKTLATFHHRLYIRAVGGRAGSSGEGRGRGRRDASPDPPCRGDAPSRDLRWGPAVCSCAHQQL